MNYRGMNALITGASSGLGEEFANQLARLGCNVVLIAGSEDRLNKLAETLRGQHKVQATVMAADLSSAEAVDRLIAEFTGRMKIDLLVNNARLGVSRISLNRHSTQMRQVDVDVRAVVTLTHAFVPDMVAAGRGGVINIASNSIPTLGGAAVYAASKAFALLFNEGLAFELEKSNVRVLAACPGPVATQFFANMQANQMDQPPAIVKEILSAFYNGKKVVIPSKLVVRLGTLGARLMPRNMILRLAAKTVRQLNRK